MGDIILSGGSSSSTGGGGGPIEDGANPLIEATVLDLVDSNPLTVAIVDANGDQISSFGGGTQYAEDTPSTAGEIITMAGVVRQDTRGTLVSNDGDRTELQVNSSGDLRVDGSAVTQPVSGAISFTAPQHVIVDSGSITVGNAAGASAVNIQDGGNSITVDGTVAVSSVSGSIAEKWDVIAPSGNSVWNNATALNTALTVSAAGYGCVMFKGTPSGGPNGRIAFEGSTDGGTTYEAVTAMLFQLNAGTVVENNPTLYANFTMSTFTNPWVAYIKVNAYTHVRARVAIVIGSGGTLTISSVASALPSDLGQPQGMDIFGPPYPSSASNITNQPVMTTGTSTNALLVALADGANNVSTIKAAAVAPVQVSDTALVVTTRDSVTIRGGAKGTTTAADLTGTPSGSNHQALDVVLYNTTGQVFGGVGTPINITATSSLAISGGLTNNFAVPGSTNVGALTALANANPPTQTEGFVNLLSTDLSGNLRVKLPSNNSDDLGTLQLLNQMLSELKAIHLQLAVMGGITYVESTSFQDPHTIIN
jgi:hypothetical protein